MSDNQNPALIQFSQNVYLLPLATNIGVIALKQNDGTVNIYLIESGNDDAQAAVILEKIKEFFSTDSRTITLKAVINTHSHADHCGGNDFLRKNTGCEVWASEGEAAIMQCPVIETGLIWGGMPVQELETRYFVAQPCAADRTFKNDAVFYIEEKIKVEVISLKGHYIDQTGFLLTDTDGKKTLFAGDALSGRNAIKRYWIQYLFDEKQSKKSLNKLSHIKADFYVPGHGDFVTQIEGLVELNLLALLETENLILDELKTPRTSEEILKSVADRNSLNLKLSQYVLIGCTLRSYLSALADEGRIRYEITENKMLWQIK